MSPTDQTPAPYSEDELSKFIEAGKAAWADVPDPAQWVRELRGFSPALRDARQLLADIASHQCNPEDEAEKWLREYGWPEKDQTPAPPPIDIKDQLAKANLVLATINDMVCGDDGPRGDGATIRAIRKLITERDEAVAKIAKLSKLAERVEDAMRRDGIL